MIDGKLHILKVEYADDRSDPSRGAELAERLIKQDGVKFMLGPYSSAITKSVSEVTEKYKVPMIVAEADARALFMRGFTYIFGMRSTSDQYFASAIDLAAELAVREGRKPSDLRVAVVSEDDPFSHDVRMGTVGTARKYAMQVVVDDVVPRNPIDISSSLVKVQSVKPHVLVFKGHAKGAETTARQIKKMRIHVPLIGLTHCEAADIIKKIGRAAEGLLCVTQWAPDLTYKDGWFGSAADYAKKFKSTYKGYRVVPYQAAAASAAVLVYKEAFERADSLDVEEIRLSLAATETQTFYGKIRFAKNGQSVAKPMVLRQIQNGRLKVVAPTKWASSLLKYPREVRN